MLRFFLAGLLLFFATQSKADCVATNQTATTPYAEFDLTNRCHGYARVFWTRRSDKGAIEEGHWSAEGCKTTHHQYFPGQYSFTSIDFPNGGDGDSCLYPGDSAKRDDPPKSRPIQPSTDNRQKQGIASPVLPSQDKSGSSDLANRLAAQQKKNTISDDVLRQQDQQFSNVVQSSQQEYQQRQASREADAKAQKAAEQAKQRQADSDRQAVEKDKHYADSQFCFSTTGDEYFWSACINMCRVAAGINTGTHSVLPRSTDDIQPRVHCSKQCLQDRGINRACFEINPEDRSYFFSALNGSPWLHVVHLPSH
jgi:hypothetical protein